MQLNGMKNPDLQEKGGPSKMVVKESKSFLFDRDYRSATTRRRMSNLANDFIIGGSIMRMTNQSSIV